MTQHHVGVKRIYDAPQDGDGARVLVDRLWPRGVSKAKADLTEWLKEVAPSTELRKWYEHDPAKYVQFAARYEVELEDGDHSAAMAALRALAETGPVTLLTASRAVEISEATVLAKVLGR